MQSQSGFILSVMLIFLVIVTVLGLSSIRGAVMEERMAANFRERDIAFQAAEAAIRDAEDYLRTTALAESDFNDDPSATTVTGNPGLMQQVLPGTTTPTNEPSNARYWRVYNWDVHARTHSVDIAGLTQRPRYAVELLGPSGTVSQRGGLAKPAPNVYRITARGVGPSGTAVVLLQSTFLK